MKEYLPEGIRFKSQEMQKKLCDVQRLRQAYENGEYLEAMALMCDNRHNLHFELGEIHGFMPREECAEGIKEGTVRDIAAISRVNKPTGFYIKELNEENGVLSAVLSRAMCQRECRTNYVEKLRRGDIITAKVTHIEPFGVFCDIGAGITSLLPIDNISVSRIPTPAARFSVGNEIKAVVKSIDLSGRITLSLKELLGTWEENAALFNDGETVTGTIRSVEPYGIFVELMPNLAGLAEYVPNVTEGESASVFIKSINPEKMKIKLIIVEADSVSRAKNKIKYFADGGHIDFWNYSPASAERKIFTDFNDI